MSNIPSELKAYAKRRDYLTRQFYEKEDKTNWQPKNLIFIGVAMQNDELTEEYKRYLRATYHFSFD